MPGTIVQSVEFDALPATLFEMYIDSKKHSQATGGEAILSRKAGGPFSAWDGYIQGVTLAVVPDRLIVQSWRASDWPKEAADSTFVLAFSATSRGGRVDMVHANVPDDERDALDQGWHDNYWEPWRAYLAAKAEPKRPKKTAKKARARSTR